MAMEYPNLRDHQQSEEGKGSKGMANPKPNILLLFTDQQRFDTIAAAGNDLICTPALDRLCSRGVRFDRCYTPSPVCVSARYSILTGLYPHRSGCADNGHPMDQSLPTLPAMLTDVGYQTQAIGKMHFKPVRHPFGFQKLELSEEIPAKIEDDEFLQNLVDAGFKYVHEPHGVRSEHYYLPQTSQLPAEHHTTQWTADRTIQFLKDRDRSRPFFVWSSFIKPHPPFDPPVPWNKLYRAYEMSLPKRPDHVEQLMTWHMRIQNHFKRRDAGIDDNLITAIRAAYYACISFVDYNVGRILDQLEAQGELDNTIIIYTSDHGELLGDYDCYGKRCFYDSAARIPMLVSWPGKFPPGEVCCSPISTIDIVPTLAEAAGIVLEADQVDGISMQHTLADENGRDYIIGQLNHKEKGVYFIFDGRYKYIYSAPDQKEYLLDTKNDPEETRNHALLDGGKPHLERLRKILIEHFKNDDYTLPLEGNRWKTYPPAKLPPPTQATGNQDARWTDPYLHIPGYEREK
ncbi:sulfatase-like hydrolase/transferase [Candidatus Poribacteria bacterium]|nr:sulfatase-like hydrolase/transferase [Candidatus Poribacteria bacterium]